VPFFFYVVHFYVLGLVAAIVRTKFGLLETYLIWLALLVMMAAPCACITNKKRNRPTSSPDTFDACTLHVAQPASSVAIPLRPKARRVSDRLLGLINSTRNLPRSTPW